MAFNGSGLFVRLYNWVNDAANGINIKSDRMDAEMDGFAAGLSNCLTRDGQGKPSAAIDWNNQNLNNVNSLGVNTVAVATSATVPDVAAGDSSGKAANTKFVATAVAAATNSAPRVAGLVGNVNATTPLTKFDLTCNFVTLRNANGAAVTLYGPHSRTVDLGLAGAILNGRDQNLAFAANSWVHLYWIWDGTTLGLIASLSATAPTLPTGYTHWCYATAIRWNGSSNIIPGFPKGSLFEYAIDDGGANRLIAAGGSTTFQTLGLSTTVPPNALRALIGYTLGLNNSANGITFVGYYRPTGSGMTTGIVACRTTTQVAGLDVFCENHIVVPSNNQQVDYRISATPAAGGASLDVLAYVVPNGDI